MIEGQAGKEQEAKKQEQGLGFYGGFIT